MNTGSCHCGAIQFEVPKKLGNVNLCYCGTCRKLNGSAFSAVAMVEAKDFHFLNGQDSMAVYESTPGKMRFYCTKCHAPVYVQLQSKPEQLRIRLGLLDFEPEVTISGHIWVKEKPQWYRINDNLPQYPEFPDSAPVQTS